MAESSDQRPGDQRSGEQRQCEMRQAGKRQLEERIIAVEEWMMHTDHLLKNLNEVVCRVHDRLDEQARQLTLLKQSLQQKTEEDEERSFEDERPPHY